MFSICVESIAIFSDDFVSRLAFYMGEINAVHPFRESNGRVQWADLACAPVWMRRWLQLSSAE